MPSVSSISGGVECYEVQELGELLPSVLPPLPPLTLLRPLPTALPSSPFVSFLGGVELYEVQAHTNMLLATPFHHLQLDNTPPPPPHRSALLALISLHLRWR